MSKWLQRAKSGYEYGMNVREYYCNAKEAYHHS